MQTPLKHHQPNDSIENTTRIQSVTTMKHSSRLTTESIGVNNGAPGSSVNVDQSIEMQKA